LKTDIDLNDPEVHFIISLLQRQVEKALAVPQKVESAVLPVYHTARSQNRLEQIGSGVEIQIDSEGLFI